MSEKPINWRKLEDDFKHKRSVVLFLGTGVDFGAPKGKDFAWDALLNHLLKYAVRRMIPQNDAGKKVMAGFDGKGDEAIIKQLEGRFPRDVRSTIVKQVLGNESYIRLIQDFLYGQITKKDVEECGEKYVDWLVSGEKDPSGLKFFSLFRLADVILRYKNIRAVVTQNYDQFLCDAIRILKKNPRYHYFIENQTNAKEVRNIEPNAICGWPNQTDYTYDNINIYHVHGFIPRYEEKQAPEEIKIVLSLDEFFEDSRNVYTWQIASQMHFLSQYTCIFCGLSLQDMTNQRLLHYVKGKHHGNLYYVTAKTSNNEEQLIMDRIKNKYHEENGLIVLYGDSHPNIYKLLGELPYGKQ